MRSSLGASRGRLVRQLLVESLLVALTGAALGTAWAWMALKVLAAAQLSSLPRVKRNREWKDGDSLRWTCP